LRNVAGQKKFWKNDGKADADTFWGNLKGKMNKKKESKTLSPALGERNRSPGLQSRTVIYGTVVEKCWGDCKKKTVNVRADCDHSST